MADEAINTPKENIDPKKLPPEDEEMLIEAVVALIVSGMALYTFCEIPCHAHLLNQKYCVN